jgi:ribosomal protein S18 acetylase RimI-like enzyme
MSIRRAKASDAKAIAKVQMASWQAAYRGLLPDRLLGGLSAVGAERRWRRRLEDGTGQVLVCEREGRMAGFIAFGPGRDDDAVAEEVAEIYALYLDPRDWRQGYGSALLGEALAALREQGYAEVTLWVLDNNQRGIGFYEASGFSCDGASKVETAVGGITLNEVRYRLSI